MSKRKASKSNEESKRRKIWEKKEDKALLELTQRPEKLKWSQISSILSSKIGRKLNGKQCRERYQNYVDPSKSNDEWKFQEKIIFLILCQNFSSRWSVISTYLKKRSDLVLKNHFHSVTKKALKLAASQKYPSSLLEKPKKVYQLFLTLELMLSRYFSRKKTEKQDKLIGSFINQIGITEEIIKEYQGQLLAKFKESHNSSELPFRLIVDISEAEMQEGKVKELAAYELEHKNTMLSQVMNIQFLFNSSPIFPQENIATPTIMGNSAYLQALPSPFNAPPMQCIPYFGLPPPILHPYMPQFCMPFYLNGYTGQQAQNKGILARKKS